MCPSLFLGAPCGLPEGHAGLHEFRHSSGHVTFWDDTAADTGKENGMSENTSAARAVLAAANTLEARITDCERLRAALEDIKRLHAPAKFTSMGSSWEVCSTCCVDPDGATSSDCDIWHDHVDGAPTCATAAIIERAGL